MLDNEEPPPVPRYRLVIEVYGNTHDELADELLVIANGHWANDTKGGTRDEYTIVGGRSSRKLIHQNPNMTADDYRDALTDWAVRRKLMRGPQSTVLDPEP